MKNSKYFVTVTLFCFLFGCSTDSDTAIENIDSNKLYFPPINSDEWQTNSISNLNWNEDALQPLLDFIETNKTKAFLILENGKIVVEWYGNNTDANSNLAWNSAAKTLVSFTAGIAIEEGFLDVNLPSSNYLGTGWSSLTTTQEQSITVKNHLTMTTGLDYTVTNNNCTDPECFTFKNLPGTFWYYHNGAYTITHNIIEEATQQNFNTYFNNKLKNMIGMQGSWVPFGYFKLYYSNARSMARFGLLNLNKGNWNGTSVLKSETYFNEMTNTSQNSNKAYGYFWWLNGKDSYRLPTSEQEYTGKLIPNAPNDLIAGLGKDDQKLYVVPSKDLVIVRMGDAANDELLGPSSFDNILWEKINNLIN
ncbi:MAG: serine hydrolase domain-containing protein [Cellulophaga sp.]|uniref:serine hydrolase domain-containing protein n=1 Tax=Cellulophaga sp. TaxID=1972202 RepID=UPI003265072A